jgi:hypothetical protein
MTSAARKMIRRRGTRALYLSTITWAASITLTDCSVQLTPPYDEMIEKQSDALKGDFLRFVAERQRTAGTSKGYYLDQPGGVSCAQALELTKKMTPGITSFNLGNAVDKSAAPDIAGGVSCVTAGIRNAQDQIELFRDQDKKRCAKDLPPVRCTTLFGTVPVSRVAVSLRALQSATTPSTDEGESTLVKAVLISLDNLEGLEQDLRPASSGK